MDGIVEVGRNDIFLLSLGCTSMLDLLHEARISIASFTTDKGLYVKTHKLIRFGILSIGLESVHVNRLPNGLLRLWVIVLECHLRRSRDEHDTGVTVRSEVFFFIHSRCTAYPR